jgi:quercetin dioxygenase-like cupin family protein
MKKLIVAAAFVAATTAFAAEPAAKAPAAPKLGKDAVYTAAADLQWSPMDPSHPDGPQLAVASGNPKTGPASVYMKFPAGFDSGWHTHKNWYVATVVKGTLTAQGQGDAAAKELPAGSYFSEPGGKNHKNTCLAGSECILFAYIEKGHTFEPKTADGKNPPKEAAAAPAAPAKKEEAAPAKK